MNVEHTVRAARENPDLVRGIKAHAEIGGASRCGLEVIKIGKQIARGAGLPLYIHLGQLWPAKDGVTIDPDEVVRELVPLMEPGDVLAHPFTRHPGGFISAATGEVHPEVWAALERGVTVDVGHGSHFSFDMARKVLAAGIVPHTLGADMHGYNVRVPDTSDGAARAANPFLGVAPFNLTNAMSKLLALGMTLPQVLATVTGNPARMLRMEDTIGSLQVGREADVTVLDLLEGQFELADNSGEQVTAEQMIVPVFALRAGRRHDAQPAGAAPDGGCGVTSITRAAAAPGRARCRIARVAPAPARKLGAPRAPRPRPCGSGRGGLARPCGPAGRHRPRSCPRAAAAGPQRWPGAAPARAGPTVRRRWPG